MDPSGPYDSDSIEVQDDPTDCLSDRQTVLSEGSNLYLPECTPDGRYQKVSNKFIFIDSFMSSKDIGNAFNKCNNDPSVGVLDNCRKIAYFNCLRLLSYVRLLYVCLLIVNK